MENNDGNRTNQAFFKKFKTQENKPWISEEGTFLLHDYVHLKSFRNLWLTERNGELKFVLNDEILVARWQDLRDLHHRERDSLLKRWPDTSSPGSSHPELSPRALSPMDNSLPDNSLPVTSPHGQFRLRTLPPMKSIHGNNVVWLCVICAVEQRRVERTSCEI